MYGIRQCNRIFLSGEIGAFFTEIFFQISVVILNSNLHYQIFKFVIDNSDISLNCLQHIQKRRNFDAKSDMSPANLFTVTCHTKWSRSGDTVTGMTRICIICECGKSPVRKFKIVSKLQGDIV